MNDLNDIKKLIVPLIKGSPVILLCLVFALLLAKRGVKYIEPEYESTAKIKLDDSNMGISNTILYKDFDLFPTTNKIATEVEVLKSHNLIKEVVERLGFTVTYYRVGTIKTSEMHTNSPFRINYDILDEYHIYDRKYHVDVINQDTFKFNFVFNNVKEEYFVAFTDTLETSLGRFHIDWKKDSINADNLQDKFYFTLDSSEKLVNKIKKNLDVKELDKDVPIIRISYKDPIPKRTTMVVNEIAQTYIDDYIDTKKETATKTTSFIDKRLAIIEKDLKKAEKDLEKYKLKNNVINLKQETEIGLKKIAQLKVQLANLEMNEAALYQLDEYINQDDNDYLDLAPQVGFGDLLFTEMVKKLKGFQAEKKKLLFKYQPSHEQIIALDNNIDETVNYLKISIENARKDIATKRNSIQASINDSELIFQELPVKEKALVTLERQFLQHQKTYNFLTEKRTEAAIASAANLSFHRILQKGVIPKAPVSPNKTLIFFISGFLGITSGMILVFIYSFVNNRVTNRDDIERQTGIPVLGTMPYTPNDQSRSLDSSSMLINKLDLVNGLEKNQAILVTSAIKQEGKTFIAKNLAMALAKMNWEVVLIDTNLHNPQMHQFFNIKNEEGISEFLDQQAGTIHQVIQKTEHENLSVITTGSQINAPALLLGNRNLKQYIEELKQNFDLVILDTPATAIAFDGVHLMPHCEHNIFVFRSGFTPSKYIRTADMISEEYKINNLQVLLNGVSKNTNYEGFYDDKSLRYRKEGFWERIKRLFQPKDKTPQTDWKQEPSTIKNS